MYRLAFLGFIILLGGCRNRPTQFDPFLGKTTVPPPPTGSVGSQTPVGAYPSSPPNWNGTTPAAPGTATTPPTSGFVPSSPQPPPTPLSGTTPPAGNTTPYQFTGTSSSPIRVVPPDPNTRSSFGSPNVGIDIMQLPVRTTGNGSSSTPGTTPAAPAGAVPPAAGQSSNYGFDPTYSQLSGRLEYSSLDNRWLLRYVAPGQKPDRFGGVAIFVPSGSMAGFNNGDFVTAQGRFEAVGSASPIFNASAFSLQRATR